MHTIKGKSLRDCDCINTSRKYSQGTKMIRPSRAEKVLGRIDRGVHILQKGIAIGQGVYQIGRAIAPLAAAMV